MSEDNISFEPKFQREKFSSRIEVSENKNKSYYITPPVSELNEKRDFKESLRKFSKESLSKLNEVYTHQSSLLEIKKRFLDELAIAQEGQLHPIDWNRMSEVNQEQLGGFRSRVNSILTESFSERGVATDEESVLQLSHLLADSIAQACLVVDEIDFDEVGIKVKEEPLSSGAYDPTDSSLVFSSGLVDAAYDELSKREKLNQLIQTAPQSLGELVMVAGHEVYHLRQHRQNPAYLHRSLNANYRKRVFEDHDAYDFDEGEMAATAFSLRFLIERRERIGDDISGVDERLIKRSEDSAYEMHLYSLIYRSMRRKLGKGRLDEAKERSSDKWLDIIERREKERPIDDAKTIDDLLVSIGEL